MSTWAGRFQAVRFTSRSSSHDASPSLRNPARLVLSAGPEHGDCRRGALTGSHLPRVSDQDVVAPGAARCQGVDGSPVTGKEQPFSVCGNVTERRRRLAAGGPRRVSGAVSRSAARLLRPGVAQLAGGGARARANLVGDTRAANQVEADELELLRCKVDLRGAKVADAAALAGVRSCLDRYLARPRPAALASEARGSIARTDFLRGKQASALKFYLDELASETSNIRRERLLDSLLAIEPSEASLDVVPRHTRRTRCSSPTGSQTTASSMRWRLRWSSGWRAAPEPVADQA